MEIKRQWSPATLAELDRLVAVLNDVLATIRME